MYNSSTKQELRAHLVHGIGSWNGNSHSFIWQEPIFKNNYSLTKMNSYFLGNKQYFFNPKKKNK